MPFRSSVERLSFPFFVVSTLAAAVLGLLEIWLETESELRLRLFWTALVMAAASLSLLAAARRQPPRDAP